MRMTDDKSRRPICFAYAGATSRADGSEVFLDGPLLRRSVNYLQMRDGFAYPLYYNTLFASLRGQFNKALAFAKQKGRGYWPTDATRTGVTVHSKADLKTIRPVWPKLWRRLEGYFGKEPAPPNLGGFIAFLTTENERIDILSLMEERGLQDLVQVNGNRVKLLFDPENLRVVGNAGRRSH